MEKDIFCKVNDKELPSNQVYEDDKFRVIMDKFPNSPGHMLIIPKFHVNDAFDMKDDDFKQMNGIIKKMIRLAYDKLNASGAALVQNNGICQEIKHYHLHIIPRYDEPINLSNEEIYQKLIEK